MKLSRVVATRLAAVTLLLSVPCAAAAQNAPKLSKAQRTTLEAVVAAVDRAQEAGAVTPATWQSHVLRASDGSHYVALRATVIDVPVPIGGAMLYVRLAARRSDERTELARSAVMEWLKGLRGDPLPMRAARSTTVNAGEMPVGGTAASVGDVTADASAALRLGDLQREREQRQREDDGARRRAELERPQPPPTPLYPFEDFDLQTRLVAGPQGLVVERGLTVGPGDYDVYVAWADPPAGSRSPSVRVLTHRLTLPGASSTNFSLSDVVLADTVHSLPAPYPVEQQSAHPYAIGALEAQPASDRVFRIDEALSVAFQVINPAGSPVGTPDVEVGFRVTRVLGAREELVGSLPPQRYNGSNLPRDFDVAKGHPLFAAVQAPLRTFARGHYKMAITAIDHVSGRQAGRDVLFDVAGTPDSLLREAPTPGHAFRRDAVLTPTTLAAVARALTPPAPSPALTQALAATAAGRFPDLLRADVAEPAERPTSLFLRGLALYGLGDSGRAVAAQLQQAAAHGAPAAPVQLMLGATHALVGDDRSAVGAWNLAREGGIDDLTVATLLVDAYLRQGDVARAAAMTVAALDSQAGNGVAARGLAATNIATARYAEALAILEPRAPGSAPDPDADFLVLHALYASHVRGHAPGNTVAGREQFAAAARAYNSGGGPHAELVQAWLDVVTSDPSR